MKIKIWGARGSVPAPIAPSAIEEKIVQAILNMPALNTHDPAAVRAYVGQLSPLERGTAGGNTTCIEIQAGEDTYIIDAGSGIRELGHHLMNGPCGRGQGRLHLFFSHPHWDHIQGFPFFRPAFIKGNRITIYSVHNLKTALTEQQRPLNFPVSLDYMQADLNFVQLEPQTPFTVGGLRVNTMPLAHPGTAYAYRLEDEHSIFVFASDAEYKDLKEASLRPYLNFYSDADVLIFDAQYDQREAWEKVDWGHSSSLIGVDIARRARVKRLVLFHHDPTSSDEDLRHIQNNTIAYKTAQNIACDIIIAYEGLTFDLTPPGAVNLTYTDNDDIAILTPNQVFDDTGIDNLEQQLQHLAEKGWPDGLVINLGLVETLTMAGLKALISLRSEHSHTSLVLANPSPKVEQVIALAGYLDFFAIYPSIEAARAGLQRQRVTQLPGRTLADRYFISSKIGDGRLGTVFKGRDTQQNIEVAIKMLSPSFGEGIVNQFMRQAQEVIALNHPHIVQVYARETYQNHSFVVEEYIEGVDLGRVLQEQGELSPRQAIEIGLTVAETLQYVHSRGILHGDLRPRNILLANTIKVTDFSLGSLLVGRTLLDSPLIFLSAGYVSPEQIMGHALSPQTDLYTLGVLLYRLFTGRLPFEGGEQEMLEGHLHHSPRPPSEVMPAISRPLERLILKLLAKHPADRYHSAQQVYRILSNLLPHDESLVGASAALRHGQQPFVGRERELTQLQALWDTVRRGEGQLVLISGSAGLGKTHLADALSTQLSQADILIGHSESGPGQPLYAPLVEALTAYVATLPLNSLLQDQTSPQKSATSLAHHLSHLSDFIPSLAEDWPDLPPPYPLSGEARHDRFMNSVLYFIQHQARKHPWLLILDDLQWADSRTFAFLHRLAHHLPGLPLLVLALFRPNEAGQPPERVQTLQTALVQTPRLSQRHHHLRLKPLSVEEVDLFLTGIWHADLPKVLAHKFHSLTQGKPLALVELSLALEDEGAVRFEHGTWRFNPETDFNLPTSLTESMLRRLNQLTIPTRTLLRQAAVLGETINLEVLGLMNASPEWELFDRLDMALERQFVQETPAEASIRFKQTEMRGIIYRHIKAMHQRKLHLEAAEALEKYAGQSLGWWAGQLAYHYQEANAYLRALPHLKMAAAQALAQLDYQQAEIYYQQLLTLLDKPRLKKLSPADRQALRLEAHHALGTVYAAQKQYQPALEHLTAAKTTLGPVEKETPPAETLATVMQSTAAIYRAQGNVETALQCLDTSLSYLSPSMVLPYSQILFSRAEILFQQVGPAPATEPLMAVISLLERASAQGQASRGSASLQAGAYALLSRIHWAQKDLAAAIQRQEQSLQLNARWGHQVALAEDTARLGYLQLVRGNWAGAINFYQQSAASWRYLGLAGSLGETLCYLAAVFILSEDWQEAEDNLRASERLFEQTNSQQYRPLLERLWGELHLYMSDIEQALAHAHRAVELAITQNNQLEEGLAFRVLGQVHLRRKKYELADAALYKSLHLLETLNAQNPTLNDYEIARTLLPLVRLSEFTPEQLSPAEANGYLNRAIRIFESLNAQTDLSEALALQDLLG